MELTALAEKSLPTLMGLGRKARSSAQSFDKSSKAKLLPFLLAAATANASAQEAPVPKKPTTPSLLPAAQQQTNYVTKAIDNAEVAIQRTVDKATKARIEAEKERDAAAEKKKTSFADLRIALKSKYPGLNADQIAALYPGKENFLKRVLKD